jgi:CheY-like chemotaxis protein
MEAFGQLAGGVAHDFNNMIGVVMGNAELLLMDPDHLGAEVRDGLKHIVRASESAANLTRQLLVFSRKQVVQSEPVALNDLIRDLTKMLKRVIPENISLECHSADQLPFVQADPGMVEQVVLNLVVNARDAMPQGGRLQITTGEVSLDAACAQANPDARPGEFACLSVSDTGSGIAPEHLQRIFEPFFTTKEPGKGTGLGLATVYGIIKQHQGWIEVSTQVGEGTTFKIFLPAIAPPTQVPAATRAQVELCGGSETILLVEDEISVRRVTRRVLESIGYTALEATCVPEALEVWRQHGGKIDLLLTDMVMSGPLSGRDLAEQLRAQEPALKVVFMSGYNMEVVGRNTELSRKTKSHFLPKPFSANLLVRTIRECLDDLTCP